MRGLHLTADLYQCRCDARWLADALALGQWCRQAAAAQGLAADADPAPAAAPDGALSLALLLPGVHVCVHTWPVERAAAVDVYLSHQDSDRSAQARGLMDALVQLFQPEWTEQRSLDRGDGT